MIELIQTFLISLIVIAPAWKICGKAGFNPYLSLVVFIPFLGLVILLLILAFANWPILKRNDRVGGKAFMFGLGMPELL